MRENTVLGNRLDRSAECENDERMRSGGIQRVKALRWELTCGTEAWGSMTEHDRPRHPTATSLGGLSANAGCAE